MDNKKTASAQEIERLIRQVAETHNMSTEIQNFCLELLQRLARKRTLDISSGQTKIWAGAIICVIARMNFLYDKSNPDYLPQSVLCETLGTKETTIGNKASLIEKTCKFGQVEEGLCKRELLEEFTFYTLPNGMVASGKMLTEMGIKH